MVRAGSLQKGKYMLSTISGTELNEALMRLKQQGKKVHSNVFGRPEPQRIYNAKVTMDSIAFVEKDHGVNRFYFYTADFADLKEVADRISVPLTLDIVTRNEAEYQKEVSAMGFTLLARMQRLVNKDITEAVKRIEVSEVLCGGGQAHVEDTEAANRLLWSTFDTRIGHLLDDAELARIIKKGEVLIIKDHGEIVTLLQRSLERHQFYINQVINHADSSYIHSLIGTELKQFYEGGGRYLYAWVQDANIASNKFHAKYGMAPDGLLDLVYVR